MRPTLALVVALACSRQPTAEAAPPAPSAPASTPAASPATVAAAPDDAGAPDASPPGKPAPRTVLHVGDSMVGGLGGLSKALEQRFKPTGAKFVRDWTVSVSIATFDREKHFADLLRQHDPDLVILTLGANDAFVPFPKSLAANVASIARKASRGRACYWITPPSWKPDTGITEIIRQNAEGCTVFDSSKLKLSRAADGIHPSDRGGVEWSDKFWEFYERAPSAPLLDAGN